MRRATTDDVARILEMGHRFAEETDYGRLVAFDHSCMEATVLRLLNNPDAAIFLSGNGKVTGMICLLSMEHPFSGEKTAFDMFWWVDPESRGDGIRLLRKAEDWARESGVKKLVMVSPSQRVSALYRRLGYDWVEESFQRSL